MGQTASEIENHIENKRMDLSQNLHELENRVKSATDWHHQFELRPMTFLGVALGGGMLLAAITKGSTSRRYYSYRPSPETEMKPLGSTHNSKDSSPALEGAVRTWENIKGALISVAALRAKEYVEGFVPGFANQYDKAESERRS